MWWERRHTRERRVCTCPGRRRQSKEVTPVGGDVRERKTGLRDLSEKQMSLRKDMLRVLRELIFTFPFTVWTGSWALSFCPQRDNLCYRSEFIGPQWGRRRRNRWAVGDLMDIRHKDDKAKIRPWILWSFPMWEWGSFVEKVGQIEEQSFPSHDQQWLSFQLTLHVESFRCVLS